MIFTLEALKAAYGDALLLHFGSTKAPRLAVIDGGPKGIYQGVLKPRLEELKQNKKRLVDGQLPIRLLMVSHIDEDHVAGVLDLANGLTNAAGQRPYSVQSLWHNSFDDIVPSGGKALAASLEASVRKVGGTGKLPAAAAMKNVHAALVIASVAQGRELRNAAAKLGWDVNKEFGGKLIQRPKTGNKVVAIDDGLTLAVLGPNQAEVEKLNKEWDKQIKKKGLAVDDARAAEFADQSVFNLSSIIVLAEMKVGATTRRMLLTGDARGDRILEGLEAAGLMKKGKCHVDLLKLPHHGSDRNVTQEFFEAVTADHYVVSSNGDKFDNPDKDTFDWLVAARKGSDPFTVYLTYPSAEFKFKKRTKIRKEIQKFIDDGKKANYKVVCPDSQETSVRVDLGQAFTE